MNIGGTCLGRMLDVEKWRALRHWDTCLHEAAHAVLFTRDGHGVRTVSVGTEAGDPGIGTSSWRCSPCVSLISTMRMVGVPAG